MAARIKLPDGTIARIRNFKWKSADKLMERQLNLDLNDQKRPDPSLSNQDADLAAAKKAVKDYGGEILEFDEFIPKPGVIY